ncbi:MAG: arginine--tRNA ligase [Deltaproteobacteria bacterium]|nr:MAG: arginine--tRNA ligase [Deltaproteobacteria bacterium]
MKKKLAKILKDTLDLCFREGYLRRMPIREFVIEIPNNPDHGHFATNLAMALAGGQKGSPWDVAEIIIRHLVDHDHFVLKAEIGGAGFINFTISKGQWYNLLAQVINLRDDYGRSSLGKKEKMMVEFVSANPTGPLHLGHGRGAALGDTLCRILDFSGYDVRREFYINDIGQQVKILGESIYSRWRQFSDPSYPFPSDGYQGDYIQELATEIAKEKKLEGLDPHEAIDLLSELGKDKILREIEEDLADFRVHFDLWYKESDLYSSGKMDHARELIEKRGLLFEEGGALWVRTSSFGDDKDRVIRKKDGQFTYFASDISYHFDKWKRGFNRVINIWGADHHGYITRVKAALAAEGIPGDWLEVLLIQLVKLWEGGAEVKMSKRAARYITLKELVDDVGVDAVRFVFLSKDHTSPLDFDIDLVKRRDSENPVYYVQYAHARVCSLFRKAGKENIHLPEHPGPVLQRLVLDEEIALIRKIAEFPSLIEEIACDLGPHRLTYYLTELASSFHSYYNRHRIVTDDKTLSQARLLLSLGVKIIIRNGLNLLGVNAPEAM